MSKRLVLPAVGAVAAVTAGAVLATSAQAEEAAASVQRAPVSAVVAGSLSTAKLQESLNLVWLDKVLKDAAAAEAAAAAQRAQAAVQSAPAAPTAAAGAVSAMSAPDYSGASGDVSSWANSGKSMSVKQCESGNNYSTNTGNGYYGAWQFDLPSWHANGGGAYASRPDLAPAWAQDQVAYNYYQNAGWGPWSCG